MQENARKAIAAALSAHFAYLPSTSRFRRYRFRFNNHRQHDNLEGMRKKSNVMISLSLIACASPSPPPGAPETPTPTLAVVDLSCDPNKPILVADPSARQLIEGVVAEQRGVAVRCVSGERLRVLSQCRLPTKYAYQNLNTYRELERVASSKGGAVSGSFSVVNLSASLDAGSDVFAGLVTQGRYYADQSRVEVSNISGECKGVTHVISGLTVGAFRLAKGTKLAVSGGVNAMSFVKAEGVYKSSTSTLDESGDANRCVFDADSKRPPQNCGVPLRLELSTVTATNTPVPTTPTRCPPGMKLIRGGGSVADFCLDTTEVTAAAYARCTQAGLCPEVPTSSWWPGPTATPEATGARTPFCTGGKPEKGSAPLNCVNYDQASTYCEALQKRLPATYELSWASRGGAKQTAYPWGNDFDPSRICGVSTAANRGPCVAGGTTGSASPDGVLDLVGNLWELTFSPSGGGYALCGGAWGASDFPEATTPTCQYWMQPLVRSNIVGFRCASVPSQGTAL